MHWLTRRYVALNAKKMKEIKGVMQPCCGALSTLFEWPLPWGSTLMLTRDWTANLHGHTQIKFYYKSACELLQHALPGAAAITMQRHVSAAGIRQLGGVRNSHATP